MGMINVQTKLRTLEHKIKALKTCYNTAGSLLKLYVQKSQSFPCGWSPNEMKSITIRFTPTYSLGSADLITLTAFVNGGTSTPSAVLQNPQTGDGSMTITVYNLFGNESVEIFASGTSPGTFSRV